MRAQLMDDAASFSELITSSMLIMHSVPRSSPHGHWVLLAITPGNEVHRFCRQLTTSPESFFRPAIVGSIATSAVPAQAPNTRPPRVHATPRALPELTAVAP